MFNTPGVTTANPAPRPRRSKRFTTASSLAADPAQPTFGDLGAATHSHHHGHGDEQLEHYGHNGHQHEHLHGEHDGHDHGEVQPAASFQERYEQAEIPLDSLDIIQEALKADKPAGLALLHEFLSDAETPPFCRSSGEEMLTEHAGQDFGYDSELEPSGNEAALKAFADWIEAQKAENP